MVDLINKVFHISDIHILKKNYKNIINSFNKLVDDIVKVPNCILIIAGDIFEYKTRVTNDDVKLFHNLMSLLENNKIKTIIIPGNHDYNGNIVETDLITTLLINTKYIHITCYSKSGIYQVNNLDIYFFSPIDNEILFCKPHKGRTSIALLHEPIKNSLLYGGITLKEARFGKSDFKEFDLVILGDIHLPQFIAPNIAYSGSFVQKHIGEGLEHGYVLWDVKTHTGNFIAIPLLESYLKLSINDNQVTALPETNPKYISLEHNNCSTKFISDFIKTITEKYGCKPDKVIDCSKFEYKAPSEHNKFNIAIMDNQFTLITDFLKTKLVNELNINEIINLHTKYVKELIPVSKIKWNLNYLTWSNIFCYGSENYINFHELQGLSHIRGKNKTGKSSVIDILILILFNSMVRGTKSDIVNKNCKKGWIKCSFSINNDEYILERYFESSRNVSNSLYAHLLTINGENITKESITETYDYLKTLIGPYNVFSSTVAALQSRQSFVDNKPGERSELLCRFLDLDMLNDIEEKVRAHLKSVKSQIKTIGDLYDEEPDVCKDLTKFEKEKSELDDFIIEISEKIKVVKNNKEASLVKYRVINDDRNVDDIIVEYKRLRDCPKIKIENTIDELNSQERDLTIELGQLKYKKKTLESSLMPVDNKKDISILNNLKVKITPKSINNLQKQIINTKKLNTNFDLAKLNTLVKNQPTYKLENLYPKILPCSFTKIKPNKEIVCDIDEIKNEVLLLQKQIIIIDKKKLKDHNEKLLKLKSEHKNFNFNSECTACKNNECELKNISGVKFLEKEIKFNTKQCEINNKCSNKINELNDIIAKYEMFIKIKEQNDALINNNKINNIIKSIILHKQYLSDIEQLNNIKLQKKLDGFEKIYNLQKIKDIRESNKIVKHKLDLLNARFDTIEEELSKIDELIENYNNVQKIKQMEELIIILKNNEEVKNVSSTLRKEEFRLTTDYETANSRSIILGNKIAEYNAKNQAYCKYKEKKEHLCNDKIIHDKYLSVVNKKTGIPSLLLKNSCKKLTSECNKLLNIITDFQVDFEISSTKVIINMIMINPSTGDETKVSADMGSGFQKFILDLVIRISISRIADMPLPNIMIIDEGFGCLDDDNFENVQSCISKLKDEFDFILIISHIKDIQSNCDRIINITLNNNNLSELKYGTLGAEQKNQIIVKTFENLKQRQKIEKTKDIENKKNEIAKLVEDKQNKYTEVEMITEIFDDPKRKRCLVCNKNITNGRISTHLLTKIHSKNLINWNPTN